MEITKDTSKEELVFKIQLLEVELKQEAIDRLTEIERANKANPNHPTLMERLKPECLVKINDAEAEYPEIIKSIRVSLNKYNFVTELSLADAFDIGHYVLGDATQVLIIYNMFED